MSGARGYHGTGVRCLVYGALQVGCHTRSTCWSGSKWVADVRGRLAAGHEKELAGALWLHASAHKIGDSFGGFDALLLRGYQSDANAAGAGVGAVRLACQKASWQGSDASCALQVAYESTEERRWGKRGGQKGRLRGSAE